MPNYLRRTKNFHASKQLLVNLLCSKKDLYYYSLSRYEEKTAVLNLIIEMKNCSKQSSFGKTFPYLQYSSVFILSIIHQRILFQSQFSSFSNLNLFLCTFLCYCFYLSLTFASFSVQMSLSFQIQLNSNIQLLKHF